MIRVFPRRTKWTPTDDLAFVGDPPLSIFRPPEMPVMVSVVFEWDIAEGERLRRAWSDYYPDVRIGGPAFGDPGGEFVPGRFIKKGVTITSRGCPRSCPWCRVHDREGAIRELEIKPGYIVQDNNLFACSRNHIERVFDMLRAQKRGIVFSGGIDARIFSKYHLDLLSTIKFNDLWFACDTVAGLHDLKRVAGLVKDISIEKRRCFVMIGRPPETIAMAEKRLASVYELGFLPFSQLYRGPGQIKYSKEWSRLNKKWSRPALYRNKDREVTP